jgi:hypothetical protein
LLSLRLVGVSLLRFEERRLISVLLFHDPPRNTRWLRHDPCFRPQPSGKYLEY